VRADATGFDELTIGTHSLLTNHTIYIDTDGMVTMGLPRGVDGRARFGAGGHRRS
jgi:hypothetical protein